MKIKGVPAPYAVFMIMIVLMFPASAIVSDIGALPPSKHNMCYEQFIKDNFYAGEYISMNAKIRDILELMSLNDTLYKQSPGMGSVKKACVMVKHRWSYELPGEFRIDEDIGIPLRDGDNIEVHLITKRQKPKVKNSKNGSLLKLKSCIRFNIFFHSQ